MDELNQITEQLEYINNSIDYLHSGMNDINNSIMNSNNGVEGLLILIALICINGNIRKLTQAIKDSKR